MQIVSPWCVRTFLAAILSIGLALVSSAQVITTSSLSGTVLSPDGKPVGGASIVATHVPTGSVAQATTRGDGSFTIRGLRPGGPYSVKTTATSLLPKEIEDVYLDIDRGADLTIRLATEEVTKMEEYQVIASADAGLFDSNQTGSGSFMSEKELRALPVGDRSINSLARLDPRISYNRDPQDRAISVNGMSNRYNKIQVDGVSASDPFGLNANNTAAERNVVPLDSLESLSVNTSPHHPRHGGFVGASINATTKSGSNDFHGSAYYTYRGRSILGGNDLVGITLDGVDRALTSFDEETFGLTLGGPIIPKKLFFFLSYEKVKENRVAPSPTAFVDAPTLARVEAAAKALGFAIGSATPPAANRLDDKNLLAKIDWQINDDHRATFRYNTVESSRPTFPGFGTGISQNNFSYDSGWYAQNTKNDSYIGQLVSRWSDRLNTEFSLSRSKYHSEPKNNTTQPFVQVRNVPVPGTTNTAFITFGTEVSRHANILDVKTDTADLTVSYELNDRNTFQTGFQYDTNDVYNLFVQNAYGNYDFNSLTDFENVASNNNGTAFNYRAYTYNQILPGVEPAARFNEGNMALWAGDTYRAANNLKFDIGLRIDRAVLPDAVPYNATFVNVFGVRNDYTYDGAMILQPRFGFNWEPQTKKRTAVRGGVGLYYGRAPRVWISNSYSNTGMNFRTWTAGNQGGTNTAANQAPRVSADPAAQLPTTSAAPAMTVAFMDNNFELPSRWKANIAFERQLTDSGIKFTAELEKSWVKNDVRYENINLLSTRTSTDGRLLYFNAYATATQNLTSGAWSGSNGTRLFNTGFTNRTIKLTNTKEGGTQAATFSIERPQKKDGWSWKASYVNTKVTEVLFGTSSVAASNWNNRSVFNPNAEEVHRGELEIKDKVLITLSKEFELVKGFKTSGSIIYEGRSGYPFSFVYTNDANGDSQTQNDLLYIPIRSGDPLVRFGQTIASGVVTQTAAQAQDLFYQIVDRFGLEEGKTVSSGSNRYPWVNTFDLSLKQEIKLPLWRHKIVLGADVLNIGNLLNDKWGLIRGSNQFFAKKEGALAATYDGTTNQWVYNNVSSALATNQFAPSLGRGEPAATRWSVLFSARYEF